MVIFYVTTLFYKVPYNFLHTSEYIIVYLSMNLCTLKLHMSEFIYKSNVRKSLGVATFISEEGR